MAEGTGAGAGLQQRTAAAATQALARFRALDAAKQGRLVAVTGIVLGCFAALLWFATRTDWRILYSGMDADDARQMAQELTTAGVPYDIGGDGSVRVPAPNLDKARLVTTASGAPRSGRMGFELFDKPNWMGSEFDEKVNYQRALEGELEHTIATLSSVQSARVHIVMARDSLFTSEQRRAKASVVLRLRHRTLPDAEAEAVRNLVASAVDDLHPEDVVLVDADGKGLLGQRGGDAAQGERDQQLASRLVETLEAVAGAGNVRASVNVDYDTSSAEETDENYDPAQTVTLSMERSEQTSGRPAPSGIPGTASNAPTGRPPLYPQGNAGGQDSKEESDTYGVSKKTRHMVQGAGRVHRLTAAVLINYQPVSAGKRTAWQPRSPDEMRQLTMLAESAVGFDSTRNDQVSVEQLPFEGNTTAPEPPLSARVLDLASHSEGLLRYGVILLAVLAFFLLVARPSVRWLTTGPTVPRTPPAATAAALPSQPEPRALNGEQVVAEKRKQQAQVVFDEVAERIRTDPGQSTRLIESWIRSE